MPAPSSERRDKQQEEKLQKARGGFETAENDYSLPVLHCKVVFQRRFYDRLIKLCHGLLRPTFRL